MANKGNNINRFNVIYAIIVLLSEVAFLFVSPTLFEQANNIYWFYMISHLGLTFIVPFDTGKFIFESFGIDDTKALADKNINKELLISGVLVIAIIGIAIYVLIKNPMCLVINLAFEFVENSIQKFSEDRAMKNSNKR